MTHPSQQENAIITEALRNALQERYHQVLSEDYDLEATKIAVITPPGQPHHLEDIRFNTSELALDNYRNDGYEVTIVSPPEFCENLWRYDNIEQAMTYNQWCKLSEFIQPVLPSLFLDNPSMLAGFDIDDGHGSTHNPPDLPPILAQKRMDTVIKPMNRPETLQAKLELTEILMANLYGEPVNENIFSEASLTGPTWAKTMKQIQDTGDLAEYDRETRNEIDAQQFTIDQQEAADPNGNGYANPGEYARMLVLNQELQESHHLNDCFWHRAERQAKRLGEYTANQERNQAHHHLEEPTHAHAHREGDRITLSGQAAKHWNTLKTQFHELRSGSLVTTQSDLNNTLAALGITVTNHYRRGASPEIGDQQAKSIIKAIDTLHANATTLDAADAMSQLNSLIDTDPRAPVRDEQKDAPHSHQQLKEEQSLLDDWLDIDDDDSERPGM